MTKEPPTTRRTGTHERVDLPIAGHVLSRCCIDWAITLEFLDGFPETRIRIGGLFSLREGATETGVRSMGAIRVERAQARLNAKWWSRCLGSVELVSS